VSGVPVFNTEGTEKQFSVLRFEISNFRFEI